MNRKEWREVSKQSLYFVLAMIGIVLLAFLGDRLQKKPLDGEKIAIMLGLWLFMFSMFMGLSPFAMDAKQKGMEYLLTLPLSRRKLLWIKLLPRLAAVILFYLAFAAFYGLAGNAAFGGGFTVFSLTYFALFLISFSLAVVHENFIVQSLWAGVGLCGYLAACLYIVSLGFSWKFNMHATLVGSRIWHDLSYDIPTLLQAIAVFLLMLVPFVASIFLAFKKFDLKPARAFNRRQLLIFVPMLLLAFAASLGVTRLGKRTSVFDEGHFYILGNGQLLKTGWPGMLTLHSEDGQQRIDLKRRFMWDWHDFTVPGKVFLTALDASDRSTIIVRLNTNDLAWNIVRRIPDYFLATHPIFSFHQYGQNLVFLQRHRKEAEKPGMQSTIPLKSDRLDLVVIDMNSERAETFSYQSPVFRGYYQPMVIGHDEIGGRRFWLIGHKNSRIVRLWDDGRAEDLGFSKSQPAYLGRLLLSTGRNSLVVSRLATGGMEPVAEIAGQFQQVGNRGRSLDTEQLDEVVVESKGRIVRIDLKTFALTDIGPDNGYVRFVAPSDYYYVESRYWPPQADKKDLAIRIYQLKNGEKVLLRQFDRRHPGQGYMELKDKGLIFHDGVAPRFFAFPDLRELRFKGLD